MTIFTLQDNPEVFHRLWGSYLKGLLHFPGIVSKKLNRVGIYWEEDEGPHKIEGGFLHIKIWSSDPEDDVSATQASPSL
jgi:hypothetical protein